MRLFILILAGLVLSACATTTGSKFEVAEPFMPFVTSFAQLGNRKITNLVVKFGEIQTEAKEKGLVVIGTCGYGYPPTITIRKTYWDSADQMAREELMFHELGHCILFRDHTEVELEDGCPSSIMDPVVVPRSCYKKHRDEYIRELFSK